MPTNAPSPHWITRSPWNTGTIRTDMAVIPRLMAVARAVNTRPASVTIAPETMLRIEATAPVSRSG